MKHVLPTGFLAILLALALVFIFVNRPVGAQADGRFVTWTDADNALSFEVPEGWQVSSALVDVLGARLPNIVLTAPDSQAVVMVGPATEGVYLAPAGATGLPEGTPIPFDGLALTVRPYQAPVDHLAAHLHAGLLTATCPDFVVTGANGYAGVQADMDAGDMTVACDSGANGYFYLNQIHLPADGVGTLWLSGDLYGYLAAPGYEAPAREALTRLVETLGPALRQQARLDLIAGGPTVAVAGVPVDSGLAGPDLIGPVLNYS